MQQTTPLQGKGRRLLEAKLLPKDGHSRLHARQAAASTLLACVGVSLLHVQQQARHDAWMGIHMPAARFVPSRSRSSSLNVVHPTLRVCSSSPAADTCHLVHISSSLSVACILNPPCMWPHDGGVSDLCCGVGLGFDVPSVCPLMRHQAHVLACLS